MSQGKVEEKNFDQGPVLFVVKIADEVDFEFFDFLENLAHFQNDENPHVSNCNFRRISEPVDDKDNNNQNVRCQCFSGIIIQNLSQCAQPFSLFKFYCY